MKTTTTFTTEACGETFKIQIGSLNCYSESAVLFKCVVRFLMLEKPKLSLGVGLLTIKANIDLSGKETEKYPRTFFTIIIVWIVI